MLLIKALKDRAVSRLWFGQLGSSIGDEIYRVAFIWIAVDLIGSETGYLASLQVFAILVFGVFGGKWADRWSAYRTMIWIDLSRARIRSLLHLEFLELPAIGSFGLFDKKIHARD